jgi:GT2 family glycosyltransferase
MRAPALAALMTCHNRAERTLACLHSLDTQRPAGANIEIVLVDAGSSDGTAEAVARDFPDVTVVHRGPELFWNGGMRVALAHAYEKDPDFYLWLNDDVELDDDAVGRLLTCHDQLQATRPAPTIVVGSTRDPATGDHTYGGVIRPDRVRRMRYQLVPPGDHPQRVETMNGNCVLVPRAVVERIGNLAAAYTHGMGDYDYGHRADRAGCEIWIAPGTIGTCPGIRLLPDPPRSPSIGPGPRARLAVSHPTSGASSCAAGPVICGPSWLSARTSAGTYAGPCGAEATSTGRLRVVSAIARVGIEGRARADHAGTHALPLARG